MGFGRTGKPSTPSGSQPETLHLARNEWVPNNEHLPVLIYRGAIEPIPRRRVATVEDTFRSNWWMPQSRNGTYDFHHYHSTAHEVLGVAIGEVRLMLGGEGGVEVTLRAGDVLVLPVGTGHCQIGASDDVMVVGAYPLDTEWDICRTAPTHEAIERIRSMEIPAFDPVSGTGGILTKLWSKPGPRLKSVARAS
jgi:uncharacterized protein YjlB